VSNTRGDGILSVGRLGFHHDHLFYEHPLTALMLYAIEIPESGSVTSFRSGASMCAALPPDLHDRAAAIECLHLYDYTKINAGLYEPWADPATASPDAESDYKPLIWHHPVTGVEVLWLSPPEGFRRIDRDGGIELFNELRAFVDGHIDEIDHYDHDWRPGDLVVWSNLLVAHARHSFDKTQPRTLRRTPIIGAIT
jgi:taurine dioxygenase